MSIARHATRSAGLLVAVMGLASCTPESVEVTPPDESFRVTLLGSARRTDDGPRSLWKLADADLRVTSQRVAAERIRVPSLDEVVNALKTRVEEGEVEGTLEAGPCRVAHMDARCTYGWTKRPSDGARVERQGVIVQLPNESFLMLEVFGPEAEKDKLQAQAKLLRDTLVIDKKDG